MTFTMRGSKRKRLSLKAILAARRQRNQELARLDRANRCAVCKVSLTDRPAIQVMGQPEKYCGECYASLFTAEERGLMRDAGE